MAKFTIVRNQFLLDGKPFRLVSGAIHYFRVPRQYWRDRLEKLLALGCNTVETYMPWTLHEPRPGVFDFSGNLDVEAFVRLADELGLKAIVRPGPYICGEFEFGGLPRWLLKDSDMRLRTRYPGFIEALARYFAETIPRIARLQLSAGGNVIACQIENEYGYYGNDRRYLEFLRDRLIAHGIEVPLFTADGPFGEAMEAGSLPGMLSMGTFGSGAPGHFEKMRRIHGDMPLVCGEFWMGWFDAWGEEHHLRSPEDAAASLREILSEGHVNLYMFHGGTNFGFTSGANHYEAYKPDVSSYDYDAPLSESGDPSPKYHAFRQVIAERLAQDAQHGDYWANPVNVSAEGKFSVFRPFDEMRFSTNIVKKAFGRIEIRDRVSLLSTLESISSVRRDWRPLSMEELDQGYGYVYYRCRVSGPRRVERFVLVGCNDRAVVYVDGRVVATQYANQLGQELCFELGEGTHDIDVLVENQGRVNFGEKMDSQRKGIRGAIVFDKHAHCDVETWGLPLDSPDGIAWGAAEKPSQAAFYRGSFEAKLDADTFFDSFLRLDAWGKGIVWVNLFNIGRFWEIGPQRTLYVPGTLLRDGSNEIVIFESEGKFGAHVELLAEPDLG
jgi:beta-galactosidase